MINFINGWKAPKFRIKDGNVLIDTIVLPISEGMIETIEELKIEHTLLNYDIEKEVHGFRLSWKIPYTVWANKNVMLEVQQLMRYSKAGYRIILTPRLDLPTRSFEVLLNNDMIEYGIKKGGENAIGNSGIELTFTTKSIIDDTEFVDPDAVQYTGWFLYSRMGVIAT